MGKEDSIKDFEKNLESLEKIVDKLESGSLDLNESLSEFEKGVKTYLTCRETLKNVQKKIKKLSDSLEESDLEEDV